MGSGGEACVLACMQVVRKQAAERRVEGKGGLGVRRSGGAMRGGEAVTGSAYKLLSPTEATSFV